MCSICGERVLSTYSDEDEDGLRRCPVCRRMDRPFERAVAYGSYDGGLRELIHLLKFGGVRPAAAVLGRMLAEAIAEFDAAFEQSSVLVIPVPLYKGKRRQRGFNQAELIAKAALKCLAEKRPSLRTAKPKDADSSGEAKAWQSPARQYRLDGELSASPDGTTPEPGSGHLQLAPGILSRARETHSQIGLTSHQRRVNLRGAFAVLNSQEVTGREILLVDDVYTTGTTASECARVLRRAGASKVWVATVARTLKLASKGMEFVPVEVQERYQDQQNPSEASESEALKH
jgi:predicted amidophosphoribosyltransferase